MSSLSRYDSVSTIWAAAEPPAVCKPLLKLGESALRVYEKVIIHLRLRHIKSCIPVSDSAPPPMVEQMFDDLWELARSKLYPERTRTISLTLLLKQLASRQTVALEESFNRLPHDEIAEFLSFLMSVIAFLHQSSPQRHHLGNDDPLTLSALRFITSVAQTDDAHIEILLRIDFVELARSLLDTTAGPVHFACQAALESISDAPAMLQSLVEYHLARASRSPPARALTRSSSPPSSLRETVLSLELSSKSPIRHIWRRGRKVGWKFQGRAKAQVSTVTRTAHP
ncbi:hypothetical protein C8J56DRAFT_1157373 [Mycena floridula]|nr:hypothetical protein C8J56DRAFT_1157373 [Mycena floridula]